MTVTHTSFRARRRRLAVALTLGLLVAGSGTTAVAARDLGRRWVVVERNPDTVRDVLLPRLGLSGA